MGLPTLDAAFTAAQALITTMRDTLRVRQVVSVYDVVGAYVSPWGGSYVLEASTGARGSGSWWRSRSGTKPALMSGTATL